MTMNRTSTGSRQKQARRFRAPHVPKAHAMDVAEIAIGAGAVVVVGRPAADTEAAVTIAVVADPDGRSSGRLKVQGRERSRPFLLRVRGGNPVWTVRTCWMGDDIVRSLLRWTMYGFELNGDWVSQLRQTHSFATNANEWGTQPVSTRAQLRRSQPWAMDSSYPPTGAVVRLGNMSPTRRISAPTAFSFSSICS
jgi:hypothetical protein